MRATPSSKGLLGRGLLLFKPSGSGLRLTFDTYASSTPLPSQKVPDSALLGLASYSQSCPGARHRY